MINKKVIKIILYGRVPSLKNSKIISCNGNRPRIFPSKNYVKWHNDVSLQILQQKIKKIDKKIKLISMELYAPDKRPGDLSNKWESVGDFLVDSDIIEDDNWFILSDICLKFMGVDKKNPRVEITILCQD